MFIKLIPLKIVERTDPESDLLDQSKMESIYAIRALKAAVELAGKTIEINDLHEHKNGQVYLKSYMIWLKPDTWVAL